MVCGKCQKLVKQTALATPGVKQKSEMYYGSPATSKHNPTGTKSSTTLGGAGVGKSKLLSKSAKNPYAAYSSSCDKCKVKVQHGWKFCQRCAFKENGCPMCGKSLAKSSSSKNNPVVEGQRFSTK